MPSGERTLLNPDYRDILSAFSEEEVEYLLVGAYALAAYGFVRTTGDIDLWVRPEAENSRRVIRALARFGAPLSEMTDDVFVEKGNVFQIGVAPRRIDILSAIDGVTFDEAWPVRREIEIDGIAIPVIDRSHLERNKEATGRPQDQVDLEWLRGKGQKET
jgi:hypothetical protein